MRLFSSLRAHVRCRRSCGALPPPKSVFPRFSISAPLSLSLSSGCALVWREKAAGALRTPPGRGPRRARLLSLASQSLPLSLSPLSPTTARSYGAKARPAHCALPRARASGRLALPCLAAGEIPTPNGEKKQHVERNKTPMIQLGRVWRGKAAGGGAGGGTRPWKGRRHKAV